MTQDEVFLKIKSLLLQKLDSANIPDEADLRAKINSVSTLSNLKFAVENWTKRDNNGLSGTHIGGQVDWDANVLGALNHWISMFPVTKTDLPQGPFAPEKPPTPSPVPFIDINTGPKPPTTTVWTAAQLISLVNSNSNGNFSTDERKQLLNDISSGKYTTADQVNSRISYYVNHNPSSGPNPNPNPNPVPSAPVDTRTLDQATHDVYVQAEAALKQAASGNPTDLINMDKFFAALNSAPSPNLSNMDNYNSINGYVLIKGDGPVKDDGSLVGNGGAIYAMDSNGNLFHVTKEVYDQMAVDGKYPQPLTYSQDFIDNYLGNDGVMISPTEGQLGEPTTSTVSAPAVDSNTDTANSGVAAGVGSSAQDPSTPDSGAQTQPDTTANNDNNADPAAAPVAAERPNHIPRPIVGDPSRYSQTPPSESTDSDQNNAAVGGSRDLTDSPEQTEIDSPATQEDTRMFIGGSETFDETTGQYIGTPPNEKPQQVVAPIDTYKRNDSESGFAYPWSAAKSTGTSDVKGTITKAVAFMNQHENKDYVYDTVKGTIVSKSTGEFMTKSDTQALNNVIVDYYKRDFQIPENTGLANPKIDTSAGGIQSGATQFYTPNNVGAAKIDGNNSGLNTVGDGGGAIAGAAPVRTDGGTVPLP
ncbi:hypothetical protein KC992_02420 [Candidatus Saccharibacteria bacterium]|nr:hypothetical protein [Candidatus Saccharibacteria bacterium]